MPRLYQPPPPPARASPAKPATRQILPTVTAMAGLDPATHAVPPKPQKSLKFPHSPPTLNRSKPPSSNGLPLAALPKRNPAPGVTIMLTAMGGVASDIWHAVRQARTDSTKTNPSASSTTATSTASTALTSGSSALNTPAPAAPSDATSKLISDINSLLLSLQGGNSPTAANPATSASSSNSTSSTAADATQVQQDLTNLASAQSKPHAHGHHHHGPAGSTDTDATAATGTNTASAASSGQTSADTTLIDSIAKAIKAYTASSAATPSGPLSA